MLFWIFLFSSSTLLKLDIKVKTLRFCMSPFIDPSSKLLLIEQINTCATHNIELHRINIIFLNTNWYDLIDVDALFNCYLRTNAAKWANQPNWMDLHYRCYRLARRRLTRASIIKFTRTKRKTAYFPMKINSVDSNNQQITIKFERTMGYCSFFFWLFFSLHFH